jgi:DNA-binding NarL/FixJ family response regulator
MKILVVDDHALFRAGVVQALHANDPSAEIVECGLIDTALERVEAGLQVGLMILDLHMPGYTGLSALQRARASCPEIPVLVLSGQDDPGTIQQCIDMGACGFLPKAAPAEALQQALKLVLSGGVFLPASCLSIASAGTPNGRDAADRWSRLGVHLTDRQREVLLALIQGKPNKVIARDLGISDGTVKTHIAHIFDALGLTNRTQAVYAVARAGLSIHDLAAGSQVKGEALAR